MSQISKGINHISQILESRIQVINTASLVSRSDLFTVFDIRHCLLFVNIILKSKLRAPIIFFVVPSSLTMPSDRFVGGATLHKELQGFVSFIAY